MMIRLWGGHYHLKGSRYCATHPLCAENEIVWCARFTFAALWPLDGRWGLRVPRVICWHCRGASNLHTEPLCISKEPRRRSTVSDRYLGPAEGRLGPALKTANHYPPLLNTPTFTAHIYIFILDFPPLLDLACHHPVSLFYPRPWITSALSFSYTNTPVYHIWGWYCRRIEINATERWIWCTSVGFNRIHQYYTGCPQPEPELILMTHFDPIPQ